MDHLEKRSNSPSRKVQSWQTFPTKRLTQWDNWNNLSQEEQERLIKREQEMTFQRQYRREQQYLYLKQLEQWKKEADFYRHQISTNLYQPVKAPASFRDPTNFHSPSYHISSFPKDKLFLLDALLPDFHLPEELPHQQQHQEVSTTQGSPSSTQDLPRPTPIRPMRSWQVETEMIRSWCPSTSSWKTVQTPTPTSTSWTRTTPSTKTQMTWKYREHFIPRHQYQEVLDLNRTKRIEEEVQDLLTHCRHQNQLLVDTKDNVSSNVAMNNSCEDTKWRLPKKPKESTFDWPKTTSSHSPLEFPTRTSSACEPSTRHHFKETIPVRPFSAHITQASTTECNMETSVRTSSVPPSSREQPSPAITSASTGKSTARPMGCPITANDSGNKLLKKLLKQPSRGTNISTTSDCEETTSMSCHPSTSWTSQNLKYHAHQWYDPENTSVLLLPETNSSFPEARYYLTTALQKCFNELASKWPIQLNYTAREIAIIFSYYLQINHNSLTREDPDIYDLSHSPLAPIFSNEQIHITKMPAVVLRNITPADFRTGMPEFSIVQVKKFPNETKTQVDYKQSHGKSQNLPEDGTTPRRICDRPEFAAHSDIQGLQQILPQQEPRRPSQWLYSRRDGSEIRDRSMSEEEEEEVVVD